MRLTLPAFNAQTNPSPEFAQKQISENISICCFVFIAYKKLGIKTTQSFLLQVKWDVCLRQATIAPVSSKNSSKFLQSSANPPPHAVQPARAFIASNLPWRPLPLAWPRSLSFYPDRPIGEQL